MNMLPRPRLRNVRDYEIHWASTDGFGSVPCRPPFRGPAHFSEEILERCLHELKERHPDKTFVAIHVRNRRIAGIADEFFLACRKGFWPMWGTRQDTPASHGESVRVPIIREEA